MPDKFKGGYVLTFGSIFDSNYADEHEHVPICLTD